MKVIRSNHFNGLILSSLTMAVTLLSMWAEKSGYLLLINIIRRFCLFSHGYAHSLFIIYPFNIGYWRRYSAYGRYYYGGEAEKLKSGKLLT